MSPNPTLQPKWKLVYASDYNALYVDELGIYPPELSIAQEISDDTTDDAIEATAAVVYRVVLDPLKVSDASGALRAVADDALGEGNLDDARAIEDEIFRGPHYLISRAWNPSWNEHGQPIDRDEWFTGSLPAIARYIDSTTSELERALCSDDPKALAWAYESIGSYHGFENFDSEPSNWTAHEFAQWPERGERLDASERDTFTEAYITCALWCGVIDERTKCDACDGTGHTSKCEECNGTGMVGEADEQTDCEECNGTGKGACDSCEGTGEIEPEGNNYEGDDLDESDLEDDARSSLTSDARDFYESNVRDLRASTLSMEQAGHDFWLTRNRHDAGFWDRKSRGPEADAALDRLTAASHPYGEAHLVLGDSGKVGVL